MRRFGMEQERGVIFDLSQKPRRGELPCLHNDEEGGNSGQAPKLSKSGTLGRPSKLNAGPNPHPNLPDYLIEAPDDRLSAAA